MSESPVEGAEHVTRLEWGDKEIFIVGTAHVSPKSVEEVKHVIDVVKPDTVCVELDALRFEALSDPDRWRKLDVIEIVKQKRTLFLLSNLALSAYQRRLGERFGVRPGAEMLAGIEKAKEIGAELVLADRDIQATLKRTWAALSFWGKSQVLAGMLGLATADMEISEEDIEKLKDRDTITEAMKELAKQMPALEKPLIDERDRWLIGSVREAPGRRIVAIVGAGHVDGMIRHLETPLDRAALSAIPPPSPWVRALGWAIPVLVMGAFYYGWAEHSHEHLQKMILAWIVPTSLGAGIGTMAALGHPLTVLSAIVSSPLTTLNPLIGVGMVTGLVEAWLKRPTVADCERIAEDSMSVRGMYKNRFTRVLVVVVLSSIGAAAGAWVGATWVISLL